jgi:cyclin B
MRGILVDWLVEVHLKYKLKHETLYLAVSLIDRFLDKRQVSRKRLQLVGVTGLLIAAKYEEIYPPEIREFVYITDKAYTREEILSMEITMLNALEFHLTVPSPVAFLERFAKLNKCDQVHLDLARYVMELSLLDLKMLRYCPSHLAASAIFLSNKLLRRHPSWPAHLIKHTRYTDGLIKSCAKEICALVEEADRSSLAAIRKKYASEKFHGVSKMVTTAA